MTRADFIADRKTKIQQQDAALRLDKTKKRPDRLKIIAEEHEISTYTVQEILGNNQYPKNRNT
jgi:hypothetical protein